MAGGVALLFALPFALLACSCASLLPGCEDALDTVRINVAGCSLVAHRYAAGHQLEPAFCIESLSRTAEGGRLSFRLLVTPSSLLSAADERLNATADSMARFVDVSRVTVQIVASSSQLAAASFVWSRAPDSAWLIVTCRSHKCHRALPSVLKDLRLTARFFRPSCQSVTSRAYSISVANASHLPLPRCRRLRLSKVLNVSGCVVRVHEILGRGNRLLVEPSLCGAALSVRVHNSTVRPSDYSDGNRCCIVDAQLSAEDSATMKNVERLLTGSTVAWMQLTGGRLLVQGWELVSQSSNKTIVVYNSSGVCSSFHEQSLRRPSNWLPDYTVEDNCRVVGSDTRQLPSFLRLPSWRLLRAAELKDEKNFLAFRGGDVYIVAMQRLDGSVRFDRTWAEYENGFGNASEFWIGLKTIRALTKNRPMQLRVELKSVHDRNYEFVYTDFSIGSSEQKYALNIGHMLTEQSSFAFDALAFHNHKAFSTKDRDHDTRLSRSCSEHRGNGGWWFHTCYHAMLTGWQPGKSNREWVYNNWSTKDDSVHYFMVKQSRMMLRY